MKRPNPKQTVRGSNYIALLRGALEINGIAVDNGQTQPATITLILSEYMELIIVHFAGAFALHT